MRLSGYLSRYLPQLEKSSASERAEVMICFFFIGVDALESKLQGKSELSGRRRSYPTDVEELWVLAIELLVCI